MDDKPKRQRSRLACESCRKRKRKCDGGQPCDQCRGYEYECTYRSRPRRTRTSASRNEQLSINGPHPGSQQLEEPIVVEQSEDQSPEALFTRSLESNSGAAFVRSFTMAVDASNPPPFQFLAWNLFLGDRQVLLQVLPQSITDIVSFADMQDLAEVYFEKVDKCYGFVERHILDQEITRRWITSGNSTIYDAVLCGVAAIGCVFSTLKDAEIETALFSLAKSLLDLAMSEEPTSTVAMAWVLRTVYLRITAKPDEAWMASCTALHLIDAAGLHRDPSDPNINHPLLRRSNNFSLDTRRRIFGVARHLNVWLSFDLARARVTLQSADPVPPSAATSSRGDYTLELLELLPYTESLDPSEPLSGDKLLAAFSEVLNRSHTQPPSILAQCNLMLCLYRRLYSIRCKLTDEILEKAVALIRRGIRAVQANCNSHCPWHHVASVPFQSVCTLLAIDTAQSFALLSDAMACLEVVSQTYPTKATKDALAAANALVYMHQKRREADVRRQGEMLAMYPIAQPIDDSFDNFPLSQAFTDLPWFNDLIPDFDLGTWEELLNQ